MNRKRSLAPLGAKLELWVVKLKNHAKRITIEGKRQEFS